MKPYIESKINSFPYLSNRIVFTFLFSIFFSYTSVTASNPSGLSGDNDALVLNPAFKIKRMSTGIVVAFSKENNGEPVRHEFESIYADVLLGAVRKQSVSQLIPVLARKYYYHVDECRREIKHAVRVLEEWEILLSNDVLP
jgi:hypothetical protein